MTFFQLSRPTVQKWWMLLMIVGTTVVLMALTHATASAEPAGSNHWSRCNDIYGSPLCISIIGKLNESAEITVEYRKSSGPVRFVRLYLQRCDSGKRDLVVQGEVVPPNIINGSKVRRIYSNSCWIGQMRILNMRFVTGELRTG